MRFGAEKDLSDVAFAAGKNKCRPKTLQTPKNAIISLSETDSFDETFMESSVVKLVANLLQTSTVWFLNWEPTSSSSFERSSFVDFQPCF